MLSALLIVVPIPLLIVTGWLARHVGLLGPQGAEGIDRFLVLFALPAFLFEIIAHASPADLWQPDFIMVILLSSAASMSLAFCVYLRWGNGLADAMAKGLGGGFTNIRYVGLPFLLITPDSKVLVPATIGFLFTTGVMLVFAILPMEGGLPKGERRYVRAREIGVTLICNSVVVTCAIAALFPVFGLKPPASADVFFEMLGGAATPCALITLGLFLASKKIYLIAGFRLYSPAGVLQNDIATYASLGFSAFYVSAFASCYSIYCSPLCPAGWCRLGHVGRSVRS